MNVVTGTRLGPYEVLSLLGAGGMGEVYRARDTRLGREVAIKFLPAAFTTDAERVLRFKHEARTTSSLNHPNIVTVHEIGDMNGRQFIVTEYIEGETLRQRIARATENRIKLNEALFIASQVAHALNAAHQAGVVHRDIKPENIMLRPDRLVKVLDFGLAKLIERQAPEQNETAPTVISLKTDTGAVMGTVAYMSPEQARATG